MFGEEKMESYYLCIDLKSFYASVECVEMGLDPMSARLVVADVTRSENTICLAVSPALKKLGVKNRCRIRDIPSSIEYIAAIPRMKRYIEYSAEIYSIYLKYVSSEDIHVYSIDECFLDVTQYLRYYGKTPRQMAELLLSEIRNRLGIYATCGIGTNLYLAKVALDISAKKSPDFIAFLDEEEYRRTLWDHEPLTDFWMIGRGISNRLKRYGIKTMKGVAEFSEDMLYREFGINAELLIDHAWGREPVTIRHIKEYVPKDNSLTSGQVLMRDYEKSEAETVLKEMTDALCLDMTAKKVVASSVTIVIGYSRGENAPSAKGTAKLPYQTNSSLIITPRVASLFRKITDPARKIRRITVISNRIVNQEKSIRQLSLFDREDDDAQINLQKAIVKIKSRYGKNAVLKANSLLSEGTARERNMQIGGHRSGEETENENAH